MKKLTERFKKNDNQEETQVIKEEKELIKQKNENEVPALIPFESRNDRVGRYFKKYLKNFLFDEFSDSFITKNRLEFMRGVPIPLRHEDFQVFQGGEGLKILHIAENMAWIMGIDPKFKYTSKYVEFMNRLFNQRTLLEGLLKEGRDAAEKEDFDNAIIHFRAALILKPDYLHAMYSYARVCREFYLRGNDDIYIGRFKAESMEYFELLTEVHPRFAQAYYYLGYDYLNLGLYQKAALVWKEFLRRSSNFQDKKEIRKRLAQLEQPITIEKGCNAVLAGRWREGLDILEPFLDTKFKGWWPLHYYLGVAYSRTGSNAKAVASFKRVLGINGSHLESIKELADLYALSGDKENERKYGKKAELIMAQIAEHEKERREREEKEEEEC